MSFVHWALVAASVFTAPPDPFADRSAEATVRGFLQDVRSGRDPDAASDYMGASVAAHQLTSEAEATVQRTPADYAAHVREFTAAFGEYEFEVEELIAQGDRVHVRWRQTGRHVASLAGEAPTGKPLVEIGAAVYRVERGRIVEYWLLLDRLGFERQLHAAVPGHVHVVGEAH